jgi:hypothetical protein
VGVLALAGCAAVEQRSDEEVIRERAQARWDLFIKGDIRGAYKYLSPGARQTVTADQYVDSIKPGLWRAARVDKVNCLTPEMCEVDLTIGIVFVGRASNTPLREKWVRVDSTWWYFYERR